MARALALSATVLEAKPPETVHGLPQSAPHSAAVERAMTDAERSLLLLVAAALRDRLTIEPRTTIDRERVHAIDVLTDQIEEENANG
jgi:hypothetical protein